MMRFILFRVLVLLSVIGVALLVWVGFWLVSPLLHTDEVAEQFPYSALAAPPGDPTSSQLRQIEAIMELAANSADEVMDEAMPEPLVANDGQNLARIRLQGQFTDADSFHRGSGDATIYEGLDTGARILRFENFQVTNGPDLRVLLTSAKNPENHGDLSAAGYVELGKLKGNVGSQNYEIPSSVELAEVGSAVIYCHPFRAVFSVATLATPP